MIAPAEKRVLFLHGLSSDGGKKTAFLRSLGYNVTTPRLSDWSFARAVRQAQAAYDFVCPDMIVGSSRGAAVAMALDSGGSSLVLLAPAWKRWGTATAVKPNTIIVHASDDKVVPFEDSVELCLNSPGASIIPAGQDHRLNDTQARKALERALLLVP
jgi:hypothetical protein